MLIPTGRPQHYIVILVRAIYIICAVAPPNTTSVPPLILRIVHRFKGENSNIGIDGARGASRNLFVYVICVWFL